jgi:Flp pilus assembly protein TadD
MRFVKSYQRSCPLLFSFFISLLATVLVSGCVSLGLEKASTEASKEVVAKASNTARGAAQPGAAPTVEASPKVEKVISVELQRQFANAVNAMKAGRTEEAQIGFLQVVQADPELSGPHVNLGAIYLASNKLPEALKELEKATQINPKQATAFNLLGVTYRQLGQFEKARAAYESAISSDPNYANATLNLGVLHDLFLNDAARAAELYTRYLALTPAGDAVVSKWLAEIKSRKSVTSKSVVKEKT